MNKNIINENIMKNVSFNNLIIAKIVADNKEMSSRLRAAAKYQKKALCALLPEGMESHVDVISNELKSMAQEMVAGLVMECVRSAMSDMEDVTKAVKSCSEEEPNNIGKKTSANEKKHGSRKIDIG
jgi:hypothetical protein